MIQQTSLFAFKEVQPKLPRSRRKVYDQIALQADATNNELSHQLNIPINQITPRTNELRKAGLVMFARTRACKMTGKPCMAWKLTNKN